MPGSEPPRDPLNLEAVDRAIRINNLEEELQHLGMESMGMSDECSPAEHEAFLKSIRDFETAPLSTQFEALEREGVELPSPDSMNDADLHAKLWEIIHALAKRDVYFYRTDHLSDRELYVHLWSDCLREETAIMPAGSGWINHLDILGGCSEQDIELSLRYYDDEETRQQWAKDFPDDVIPPHEDPPFQRDRLLPKPPESKCEECFEDGFEESFEESFDESEESEDEPDDKP